MGWAGVAGCPGLKGEPGPDMRLDGLRPVCRGCKGDRVIFNLENMGRARSRRHKIALYRAFYASTLWVSIPVAVVLGGICSEAEPTLSGKVGIVFFVHMTVGLLAAFGFKEMMRKNEYDFYCNAGCGRAELWGVSFAVSFSVWISVSLLMLLVCV